MLFYMAPLEGLTTYIYRNAFHRHFPPMDKYFTPFIVPASKRPLRTRELRDTAPENNAGLPVVPQILTNNADMFLEACKALADLGYEEVNLNTGCPSGTVTSHHKGAGFLQVPDLLDAFLDQVFRKIPIRISVKTRLGWSDPSEFENLLPIFNRYPLSELILHPRVREEYYRGTPHRDAFAEALENSRHPLVFNGTLFTAADIRNLTAECPGTSGVMLGRGLLANPHLPGQYRSEKASETIPSSGAGERILPAGPSKDTLRAFHDDIYNGYLQTLSGPDPVIHKMKELWGYLLYSFSHPEKHEKALRKAHRLSEYELFVSRVFAEEELSAAGFRPPSGWQVR